jgi:hypothetical protein
MEIVVHTFNLGDVEDPDIYAGEPLHKWTTSEQGLWVIEHASETPIWRKAPDYFGWRVSIYADLQEKDITFFKLKWSN